MAKCARDCPWPGCTHRFARLTGQEWHDHYEEHENFAIMPHVFVAGNEVCPDLTAVQCGREHLFSDGWDRCCLPPNDLLHSLPVEVDGV